MRAARTDKGVSAMGQLVSLKMLVEFPNYDVIANINKHLPDQIRVLGYTKVTGGFDARKHCDKRRYEYVLPAWAFDPNACRSRISTEEAELASAAQDDSPAGADSALPGPPPRRPSAPNLKPNPNAASHTDAQLASTAADAAAESTAAAVASDAVMPSIPDSSPNSCHTHALQPNPNSQSLDLPQPSPAEAVPAALPLAAHTAQTQPQQQQPSEANTEPQPSGQTAQPTQGAAANCPADDSADALPSATSPSAPETSDAEVTDVTPQAAQPMSSEAAPSTNSPPAGPSPAAAAASPAAAAEAANGHAAPGSDFIFDAAAVARLTSILQQYEGTHNFHNFTVRLEASDPSAKRYMLSCKCDGVFQIQVLII